MLAVWRQCIDFLVGYDAIKKYEIEHPVDMEGFENEVVRTVLEYADSEEYRKDRGVKGKVFDCGKVLVGYLETGRNCSDEKILGSFLRCLSLSLFSCIPEFESILLLRHLRR